MDVDCVFFFQSLLIYSFGFYCSTLKTFLDDGLDLPFVSELQCGVTVLISCYIASFL